VVGSFPVTRFFDLFECPGQILHGSLSVRIAANGQCYLYLSNFVLFVLHLLRMGELRDGRVRSKVDSS
jgi:hypothetical protein